MFNYPKTVSSIFCKGLLSLALLVSSTSFGIAADLPTLDEFKPKKVQNFTLKKPIPTVGRGNNPQALKGMKKGALWLSFPKMGNAESLKKLDDSSLFIYLRLRNFNNIVQANNNSEFETVLSGLNAVGPTSMQLITIPKNRSNFATVAELYYRALVAVGPLETAIETSLQMPVERVPSVFLKLDQQLAMRVIREGNEVDAEKIISKIRLLMPESAFADFAFTSADLLRTNGKHRLAAKIYGTVAQSDDEEFRQRSLLWAVYGFAVSGEAREARELLTALEEPSKDSSNFTQYCLARGRLAMLEEDHDQALYYISRAMVLASLDASFKPELYYLLSQAYRLKGDDAAADRLTEEFTVFYPENEWLKRMKEDSTSSKPN